MTGELYIRQATVQVANVIVRHEKDGDLRIRFRVTKNPWATEPNKAHVTIYNLAPDRREILNELVASGHVARAPVIIEAGYKNATSIGVLGTIFKGSLRSVTHSRDRGDWATKIAAASFVSGPRDLSVNETYRGPNLTVGSIAVDLLKKISKSVGGLDITEAVTRALSNDLSGVEQTLNKAVSVDGMGMDVLERLVSEHGFGVSEQDGKIRLIKYGERMGRSVKLSADSGLVGAVDPVTDANRPGAFLIRARSLLRHDIQIGTGVEIDSEAISGLFVTEHLEHQGDVHGGSDSFITLIYGRGTSSEVQAVADTGQEFA